MIDMIFAICMAQHPTTTGVFKNANCIDNVTAEVKFIRDTTYEKLTDREIIELVFNKEKDE